MPHGNTTGNFFLLIFLEENYTAMGTNGICFESITNIHNEKNTFRIIDFKSFL
jgi:hypothetical protein